MKRLFATTSVFAAMTMLLAAQSKATESAPPAKEVLERCISKLGGADRLANIETISYDSVAHTFAHGVEISDSLPGLTVYERHKVAIQPVRQRVREEINWRWTESPMEINSQLTTTKEGGFTEAGGKKESIAADKFYGAVDLLAANPVASLLSALASSDLHLVKRSAEEYEISFRQSVYGQAVDTTLAVDARSWLLRWVQIEHSYSRETYSSMWGNTAKRFVFSGWSLDADGVYLPTKWKLLTNGVVDGQESLFNLKVNAEIPASTFEIPDEFKSAFDKLSSASAEDLAKENHGADQHVDLSDGVVMLPGKQYAYNSLIVKQDNGIVIVEAPFSNANSEYIIRSVGKLYPGSSIVGVVSTNQFWFHVAGLGVYAQKHIPMYVLDGNVELVRRILAAQVEDSATAARRLRTVRERTEIGTGTNRIVLLPFRGSASARMMAVYFPGTKLLYCSDLYLPEKWGHEYWTEHLAEIRDLIDREHLDVRQVAGVSMPPRDWKELGALIPSVSAVARD